MWKAPRNVAECVPKNLTLGGCRSLSASRVYSRAGGGDGTAMGLQHACVSPPLHTHPLHVQRYPSTHLSTHALTMHSPPPPMHAPLHQPPHVHSLILSLYVGSPALWL